MVEQDIIKKKDKGLTPNSHVKVRDNEAFVNVVNDSDDEDEKNKTNYDNYISQKNMSSDVQINSQRSGYASNTEFLYTSMNMATGFILFKGAGTFSGGPRSMQYIIPNRNIHVHNLNLLEESKQSKGKQTFNRSSSTISKILTLRIKRPLVFTLFKDWCLTGHCTHPQYKLAHLVEENTMLIK